MLYLSKIKPLYSTIIFSGILTLIFSQRHMGFAVLFEVLALIPCIFVWLWKSIKNPQQRGWYMAKIGIWLLSVVIIIGIQYVIAIQTQKDAQKIVNAILAYYESHSAYPENIQSIGYTKEDLRSIFGAGGYFFKEGKPYFFYASTYIPFETEHYDFIHRQWIHNE